MLGFYFSYKQWQSLPASDFPQPPSPPGLHLAQEEGWPGLGGEQAAELCLWGRVLCSDFMVLLAGKLHLLHLPPGALFWAVSAEQLCFATPPALSCLCVCRKLNCAPGS